MTARKKKYKSALLSFFVALACLSLSARSVWIFWQDLNSSSARTDKEVIATISFKQRVVQRKFDDRVVWESLRQDADLYLGDKIHTSNLSQANIRFKNSVEVEIGENSMIQLLKTEGGGVRLFVGSGSVEVDTTSATGAEAMQIDMGGVVVSLDSGSRLSAANDGANSIKLTEGSASVAAGGKTAEALSAGEAVEVSESGEIKKTAIAVTSVSEKQKVLSFGDKKGVDLKWEVQDNPGKKIIVQTSSKKDFSDIKGNYTFDGAGSVNIQSGDGALYWRVFQEGEEKDAATGRLLFESVPEVACSLPGDNAVFNYYDKKPKVNFAWRGNENAEKYRIEISKDADFKNPEIVKEAFAQNFSLSDLDDGKYYWRVTPYYPLNKIGWRGESGARAFTIEKHGEPLPPELAFPVDGKKFEYSDATFNADFSWKAEGADCEYELQIARDAGFGDIVLNEKTKAKNVRKTLDAQGFGKGEYFWCIVMRSLNEGASQKELASQARKFAVAKKTIFRRKKLQGRRLPPPPLERRWFSPAAKKRQSP